VDLAGWSQAVQPGQEVVMFLLAPDADGDGQGELMFGSNAVATPGGSVVTTPTPRSEVYGLGTSGGLTSQAALSARPGQILTVTGRGFNPFSTTSNAARYGDLAGPLAETLLYAASAGSDAANPLQHLSFAVPALTPGSQRLRLHNLTTGHATEVMDLSVVPAGTGDQQVLQGFIQQVSAAAGPLAVSLASESLIGPWLTTLKAATSEVLAAMAANSGLVT